jgi:hypothetical protein
MFHCLQEKHIYNSIPRIHCAQRAFWWLLEEIKHHNIWNANTHAKIWTARYIHLLSWKSCLNENHELSCHMNTYALNVLATIILRKRNGAAFSVYGSKRVYSPNIPPYSRIECTFRNIIGFQSRYSLSICNKHVVNKLTLLHLVSIRAEKVKVDWVVPHQNNYRGPLTCTTALARMPHTSSRYS